MKKLITLLLLITVLFTSCSGNFNPKLPYEYSDDGTWEGIFSGFWHGMNENYVFWDIDKTDWDEVYRTHLPLFRELGKYDKDYDKNEKAARYFYDIVTGLSDGHLSVTLNLENDMFDGGIEKFIIHPGLVRLAKRNGKSDDEIFEAAYGDNASIENILQFLPEEVMSEKTTHILTYDFGFSFFESNNSLKSEIQDHSKFKNSQGKTVLLYSNRYPTEKTETRSWGEVNYYDTSDVIGSEKVNKCFSSWTRM